MKKIKFSQAFVLIVPLLIFSVALFSQVPDDMAEDTSETLDLDPVLKQEFMQAGVSADALLIKPGNFFDGSLDVTGKLIRALNEGKLFKNDPETRKQWVLNVKESKELFFPWETNGSAKVIFDGDNPVFEVYDDSSIGQPMSFSKKSVTIEADVNVISSGSADALEILLQTDKQTIILDTIKLSQIGAWERVSVKCARHGELVKNSPLTELRVMFHVRKDKDNKEPTVVRLDNLNIAD